MMSPSLTHLSSCSSRMADSDAEKLVVAGGDEATKEPLPAQAPQEAAITITTQPAATEAAKVQFRDYPVWITDSKGNQFQTQLRYKNGLLMWVAVGILCLIGAHFLFPCVGFLALCIKALKDVEHINPNDGTVVGVYDRGTEVGLTRKNK